jgi:hypothetical protein
MRSFQEVSFRLRQEAANAVLYAFQPRKRRLQATSPLAILPQPRIVAEAVGDGAYRTELLALADQILRGKISIFGSVIDYGARVSWRRDPVRGTETPLKYFRSIPYLNLTLAGDHKLIWEVNRHQHLVVIAQAYVLTGRDAYLEAIVQQLTDWWSKNPFQQGINWASALEVAFRAFSWIWVWHLLGSKMPESFRQRFLSELYLHGLHLQYNLSIYFSPNTHLLGESIVLHALGSLFPDWPRANAWRDLGRATVGEHMASKVMQDGSYYEQSSYYQIYALDMFLFHALLEPVEAEYLDGLERMAEFLAALLMPDGRLPFMGDDDGGRLFHPFGERARFAVASVATASLLFGKKYFPYSTDEANEIALWWLGPKKREQPVVTLFQERSRVFPDSGIVVLKHGDIGALFDAGRFGPGNAGHSHADTLSLVAWKGTEEILIDPGTYGYMDRESRQAFRCTAAHNTVRIDERDQAVSAGPFRWTDKADVTLIEFTSTPDQDVAVAECRYASFTHRRTVRFSKGHEFQVVDELDGPPGVHLVEQFWHLGAFPQQVSPDEWRIGHAAILTVENGACEKAWRSRSFGSREESPVIISRQRAIFPVRLEARLKFAPASLVT